MTVVPISTHIADPCPNLIPIPNTLDSLRYLSTDHSLLNNSVPPLGLSSSQGPICLGRSPL
jgi:hypothetical protein